MSLKSRVLTDLAVPACLNAAGWILLMLPSLLSQMMRERLVLRIAVNCAIK